jgi:sulfur carrier protein
MIISIIDCIFKKKRYYYNKRANMKLIINGETKEFSENITLEKVLDELGLRDKVMAAAVNMEIVKQDKWGECVLNDMDKLELLDFVGGG